MNLSEPLSVTEGLLKKIAALQAELHLLREENSLLSQKKMGKRALCNALSQRFQRRSM